MSPLSNASEARGRRRAVRLNDARLDWARTPRIRRRLVLTMSVIIILEAALFLVWGFYDAPHAAPVFIIVLALLLITFVLCLGTLKAATRGVEELDPERLDERQMQIRGVVYAQAYKIGAGLLTTGLAAAVGWALTAGTYPPSPVLLTVLLVTFQTTLLLPTLVAAWHQRV